MAGKMGVGTGETEQTILSRLDSDIQEQRVRVGYLSILLIFEIKKKEQISCVSVKYLKKIKPYELTPLLRFSINFSLKTTS